MKRRNESELSAIEHCLDTEHENHIVARSANASSVNEASPKNVEKDPELAKNSEGKNQPAAKKRRIDEQDSGTSERLPDSAKIPRKTTCRQVPLKLVLSWERKCSAIAAQEIKWAYEVALRESKELVDVAVWNTGEEKTPSSMSRREILGYLEEIDKKDIEAQKAEELETVLSYIETGKYPCATLVMAQRAFLRANQPSDSSGPKTS